MTEWYDNERSREGITQEPQLLPLQWRVRTARTDTDNGPVWSSVLELFTAHGWNVYFLPGDTGKAIGQILMKLADTNVQEANDYKAAQAASEG